jgi:hypothetical protein
VLWERIERLDEAFDQEQRRRFRPAQRPGEAWSGSAAASAGFAAQPGLSGDLGAPSDVSGPGVRVAEQQDSFGGAHPVRTPRVDSANGPGPVGEDVPGELGEPAGSPDRGGPVNMSGALPPPGTDIAAGGDDRIVSGEPAGGVTPTGFSGGLWSGSLPMPSELAAGAADPRAAGQFAIADGASGAGPGDAERPDPGPPVDFGQLRDLGQPGDWGQPADLGRPADSGWSVETDRPGEAHRPSGTGQSSGQPFDSGQSAAAGLPISGGNLFGASPAGPPEAAASGRHASGPNVFGAAPPAGPAHQQPVGQHSAEQRSEVPEPDVAEVTHSFSLGDAGTLPQMPPPAPGPPPAQLSAPPGVSGDAPRLPPFPLRPTPERVGNPPGPPSGGFVPPNVPSPPRDAPPASAPERTSQLPAVPPQPPAAFQRARAQQDQGQQRPFPPGRRFEREQGVPRGFQAQPPVPDSEPVTQQVPAVPPEPEPPRAPKPDKLKYRPRADGGFGPTGSSGLHDGQSRQPSTARPTSWAWSAEDESEEVELWTGDGYRPEDESAAPQYLVEADELFDDDFESVLVAPPVLGAPHGPRQW